jgi:hypothetical protein
MVSIRELIWGKQEKKVDAGRASPYGTQEDKGTIDLRTRWTDKQPHPVNMGRYEKVLRDPEVSIAINLLADMIVPSYYTEMPEDVDEEHANKKLIDKYGEDVNLDEDLQITARTMLGKGFCPVERLSDYDLKILPPETFFIYKSKQGKMLKYTQEIDKGIVATWEGKDMEDIILFVNNEDPTHPYGHAVVDPIVDLVEARQQMNKDMPLVIHNYAYPTGVLTTSKGREAIQKQFEEKEPEEWIFIGNVMEGEVKWDTITVDPRASWINYIELIYYQICEALHAPLLLYLKNATEASANVMMEAVDRYVQGIQRYIKRRVERYLFEPQCGEPVPRLVWGQPKTGLEEIELSSIAQLVQSGAIMPNQAQDLLKKLGLDLVDPEEPKQPMHLPFQQPFQKQPMAPPIEQVLDKLNDLGTQLNVIYANFQEKRLSLIKAMQLGRKAIEVQMKRAYGYSDRVYEERFNEEFEKWAHLLLGVQKEKGKEFKVIVPD